MKRAALVLLVVFAFSACGDGVGDGSRSKSATLRIEPVQTVGGAFIEGFTAEYEVGDDAGALREPVELDLEQGEHDVSVTLRPCSGACGPRGGTDPPHSCDGTVDLDAGTTTAITPVMQVGGGVTCEFVDARDLPAYVSCVDEATAEAAPATRSDIAGRTLAIVEIDDDGCIDRGVAPITYEFSRFAGYSRLGGCTITNGRYAVPSPGRVRLVASGTSSNCLPGSGSNSSLYRELQSWRWSVRRPGVLALRERANLAALALQPGEVRSLPPWTLAAVEATVDVGDPNRICGPRPEVDAPTCPDASTTLELVGDHDFGEDGVRDVVLVGMRIDDEFHLAGGTAPEGATHRP